MEHHNEQKYKKIAHRSVQKIIQGDCLEEMKRLESDSIDLILTDPPYGTIKDLINPKRPKSWGKKEYKEWDDVIDIEKMFEECNRILKKGGRLILFSQDPFTTDLINRKHYNINFNYRAIWLKDNFANPLLANKAMVKYTEDILIFTKNNPKYDFEGIHPLRPYFKKVLEYIKLSKKQIMDKIGQTADHCLRIDSTQFSLCTEETYNKLIELYGFNKEDWFIEYDKLKEINESFYKELRRDEPTFNLWEGRGCKSNVLEYAKDPNSKRLHPTQKPVALLKDLIKTFSNEGDLILDFTAGSFSTLVACQQTNRNGIGIELDAKFCEIGRERLQQTSHKETNG